jgi:hypothetical protein
MDSKVFTTPPPPALPADVDPFKNLTANELDLHKKVFDHFSKPDYVLPGLDKGELSEEEKFWLVRTLL